MADITINISSDLTASERRVSNQWSLSYLKKRIELITGIPPEDQQILLYKSTLSAKGIDLTQAKSQNEDLVTVADLDITPFSRLHINDTRLDSDLSDLAKGQGNEIFELKEEDYDKRTDSIRHWKKSNQLGRFDPNYVSRQEELHRLNEKKAEEVVVGSRFRTLNDKNGERRGTVRYVGKVPEIDTGSTWIGVEFDEPVGKNDGSIKSVRYFHTNQNYGGFLKPAQIEQGDFPEESLVTDEEDLDEI